MSWATTNSKPKIAVIGLKGLPAFGGAAAVGENIIEQLKDKYDFTIYCTSSHTAGATSLIEDANLVVFSSLPFKRLNTLYYYLMSAIHAVIKGHYDLVHMHHRDAAFLIPVLRLRYKVLLTTHGIFDLTDKWRTFRPYFFIQEYCFVRFASAVTCVSKREREQIRRRLKINAILIPNGVPSNAPMHLTQAVKKDYIFFGAGRMLRTKGCDLLLEALTHMNFKGRLLVAGDLTQNVHYGERLKTKSKGLDVEFLGIIKDKEALLEYIANSRLFVFPSLLEAMSMMLLEAASVGAPIVCSDIESNTDIFGDKEVLFFKTGDKYDLAEKIKFALENQALMNCRARNAQAKVTNEFSWALIAVEYANIYEALLTR